MVQRGAGIDGDWAVMLTGEVEEASTATGGELVYCEILEVVCGDETDDEDVSLGDEDMSLGDEDSLLSEDEALRLV